MKYARFNRVEGILPTQSSLNPATGEGEYGEPDSQLTLVLFKLNDSRTRPTRVLTGYSVDGKGYAGFELGTKHSMFHDQTGAFLGDYEVVGIRYPDGTCDGNVPDRKIKHSVFK
jgi:hypothetical protein